MRRPKHRNRSFIFAEIISGAFTVGRAMWAVSLTSMILDGSWRMNAASSTTRGKRTPEERALAGIDEGLIRVSVGLEKASDLIEDFSKVLR